MLLSFAAFSAGEPDRTARGFADLSAETGFGLGLAGAGFGFVATGVGLAAAGSDGLVEAVPSRRRPIRAGRVLGRFPSTLWAGSAAVRPRDLAEPPLAFFSAIERPTLEVP